MKKLALLLAISLMAGSSLTASNNPVLKETTTGKTIEVELLNEGNMNLFSNDTQFIPATIPLDPFESYFKTFTTYYISKANNDLVEVHCANYKDVLNDQMADKPELTAKIGQKGYKYSDLETIVQVYNKN